MRGGGANWSFGMLIDMLRVGAAGALAAPSVLRMLRRSMASDYCDIYVLSEVKMLNPLNGGMNEIGE